MKKAICIVLAVLLLAAVLPLVLLPGMPQNAEPLLVVGHRGYSGKAPENTLAAFRLAGEHGFWGCEFDIYPSADGHWVVMHDKTLDRMTDGTGKITEKTLAELKELHITAGNGIETYPDERIPTLEEALEICEQAGMRAFVELKGGTTEQVAELAKFLSSRPAAPVVISFDLLLLQTIKQTAPQLQTYLLIQHFTNGDLERCLESEIGGIDFNYQRNLKKQIAELEGTDLQSAAWTVNSLYAARMLQKQGVGVFTSNEALHEEETPALFGLLIQKYLYTASLIRAWAAH